MQLAHKCGIRNSCRGVYANVSNLIFTPDDVTTKRLIIMINCNYYYTNFIYYIYIYECVCHALFNKFVIVFIDSKIYKNFTVRFRQTKKIEDKIKTDQTELSKRGDGLYIYI